MSADWLRELRAAATPGPWAWWEAGYFDSGEPIVNLGNAEERTKFPVLDCAPMGDPDEADARLIALAPDLAELCADMAEALDWIEAQPEDPAFVQEKARDALARLSALQASAERAGMRDGGRA